MSINLTQEKLFFGQIYKYLLNKTLLLVVLYRILAIFGLQRSYYDADVGGKEAADGPP